jgi:molybdenum cofactor synthesis domain-containing protein
MSSSTREPIAAVLTVSDSCSHGERVDQSGPAVTNFLKEHGFIVVGAKVCPDDQESIKSAILELADKAQLVITTGGTGIAPRDVTPEATRAVCDRLIEGIPERMRFEGSKRTKFAALSRGVCGVCGTSLILNLPGSPTGAVESLEAVIELLPHALRLLSGNTEHKEKRE